MKNKKMTLEQFADMINAADEWKLEFDDFFDIIVANRWIPIFDEWHICHDGKNMIYFDDNGKAQVKPIEDLETTNKDRFAVVQRGEFEYNYIDTNGKLLSNEWFKFASYFYNGFAVVQRKDSKWNFITKDGKIISDKWFKYVEDFQ